ncbi:hypothetical protein [Azospirillum sp. SYSU D00513]|uniref:hypothetical protein n=1 Tax=Azospirillum sp. SYSU D00513 TaxID=2812561 RepID=UPI001A97AD4F|nr:hypothetical protein [Azospirillum sp. SYSU D00513]
MRASLKIMTVVLMALVFVLSLVALLNFFKFQSSLQSLTERRLSVITADVRESLEAGLSLGLSLKHFENAPAILERARALDEGIAALYVFAADGRILHSTDRASAGKLVDRDWMSAQREAHQGLWHYRTSGLLVLGHRLDSSFAAGVGGLALVYPTDALLARVNLMRGDLMAAAALTLLGFSTLAAAPAILASRHLERIFAGIARTLVDSRDTGDGGATPLTPPLLLASRRFNDCVARTHAEIDAVEQALRGRPGGSAPADRPHGGMQADRSAPARPAWEAAP